MTESVFETYKRINAGDHVGATIIDDDGEEFTITGIAKTDVPHGKTIGSVNIGNIPLRRLLVLEILAAAWTPKFKAGDLVEFYNDNDYFDGRLARVVKVPDDTDGHYYVSTFGIERGGWPEENLRYPSWEFDASLPYTDGKTWFTYDSAYRELHSLPYGKKYRPEKLDRVRAAQ